MIFIVGNIALMKLTRRYIFRQQAQKHGNIRYYKNGWIKERLSES
jgi:hypothetical protein